MLCWDISNVCDSRAKRKNFLSTKSGKSIAERLRET
jgi:hypothetical protein